ncbi:phospholipase A [Reichenbachiella agarivorans]|uniref:Phosphatidylcholine 1-acylhydrolase n=1 Tax=Reichenbachiella agarivorans TaxID=2979464 RepID=A0ABY6CK04_9BACT|nr:phospholipase A [Reichenbachiella agarivorans]UXP30822.1 phospholipase A [Reichenbachiella agarivorans]
MINQGTFKHTTILFLLIFSFICLYEPSLGQSNEAIERHYKDSIQNLPSFTIYGDNYLITGTTLGEHPTAQNSDAKLQFGFKQRLTRHTLPGNTFLYFTYQQTSLWNIYEKSYPFRDHVFHPSLGLGKMLFKDKKLHGGLWLAFEHESNGRGGDESRGWNYISLMYITKPMQDLTASLKTWMRVDDLKGNEDLMDYKSYFELGLGYRPHPKWIFQSEIRKSFTPDWKGKLMLSASWRITEKADQFIYLQYYNGYAESLLNYSEHVNMLRIGFAIKDLSFLFKG